jgi:hypothetical protein
MNAPAKRADLDLERTIRHGAVRASFQLQQKRTKRLVQQLPYQIGV